PIASTPSSPTDPEAIARGAIAELRSWAGSAMVTQSLIHQNPPFPSATGSLDLAIYGMDYSTIGVSPQPPVATGQAAIDAPVGVAYGPPWVAECAAHIRSTCPANFDANWVQHANQVTDSAGTWILLVPFLGSDGGRVAHFVPNFTIPAPVP